MKNVDIAPTACLVAWARALSDIPYALEIAKEIEKLSKTKADDEYAKSRAVTIEARYKLINKLLLENKETQVLELASGLLPRGLLLSQKGITFVETDLPKVMNQKRTILKAIESNAPKSLFLENANALKLNELNNACKHFNPKLPLAIIHEGLLRYLSFEEKAIVAENIHSILKKFSGVWITCDITLLKNLKSKEIKNTKKITNVDIANNAFESVEQAKAFFEKFGFSVEVRQFQEIESELVTPARLGITKEQAKNELNWNVFAMRIKQMQE